MSKEQTTSADWTNAQAYILAVFCLALGVALGYLFRGSASPAAAATVTSAPAEATQAQPQATLEQQKAMMEQAVEPLLATLKDNPNDFDTITKVGNLYYDGQQYPEAIKYYERALKIQPNNPDLLTDFGTALWYTGDADGAVNEFQLALKSQPGRASTRFRPGSNCCKAIQTIQISKSCKSSSIAPNNTPRVESPRPVPQITYSHTNST
jgi:tetratricopeptide (TPR) repeat protein